MSACVSNDLEKFFEFFSEDVIGFAVEENKEYKSNITLFFEVINGRSHSNMGCIMNRIAVDAGADSWESDAFYLSR